LGVSSLGVAEASKKDERVGVRRVAALGAVAWVVLLATGCFRETGDALVAAAIAWVVPLGAALSASPDASGGHSRAFRILASWIPFGVGLGLSSFAVREGAFAGICAAGWLFACVAMAACGIGRILRRGLTPVADLVIDIGHVYLPVGGIWLVASRGAFGLLGFHEPLVLYTANHFHFAGFGAPVIAGLLGRQLGLGSGALRRVYAVSALVVAAGIVLVAAGITLSRALELPSAIFLGLGMLGVATVATAAGAKRLRRGGAVAISGALLLLAGAALLVSMTFAVVFTVTGSATRGSDAPLIPYDTMAAVHGVANAIGFATSAVVAFTLAPPPVLSGPFGGTWPKLFGRGFIGPDFFERMRAVDPHREVGGQLASLDAFAHTSFAPHRVRRDVRAFYERTSEYTLHVTPHWHHPFRLGGVAFAWFARHVVGQLELPTVPDDAEVVATRLFAIRDELDGRSDVRGYVRTYGVGSSQRANYVAAYSTHRTPQRLLLSCAFPLPFSSLLGVLRFEDGEREGSLALTSRPSPGEGPRDEGMFLVTRLGPLRLPVDERLEVWADAGDGSISARHRVRVFGLAAFTLDYAIGKTRIAA
jgi:hypothetical protein